MTLMQTSLLVALSCIYFAILGWAPTGPEAIGQVNQVASVAHSIDSISPNHINVTDAAPADPPSAIESKPPIVEPSQVVPATNRKFTPLIIGSLFLIGYLCNRQQRF